MEDNASVFFERGGFLFHTVGKTVRSDIDAFGAMSQTEAGLQFHDILYVVFSKHFFEGFYHVVRAF